MAGFTSLGCVAARLCSSARLVMGLAGHVRHHSRQSREGYSQLKTGGMGNESTFVDKSKRPSGVTHG